MVMYAHQFSNSLRYGGFFALIDWSPKQKMLYTIDLTEENEIRCTTLVIYGIPTNPFRSWCHPGADPGGPGPQTPRPSLDPRFWGPKIEHFWALFNFFIIFFASLCSAYYFFNMLLFHSSNSKIFQLCFTQYMISHLQVFVFGFSFTHYRLLGVHLSFSYSLNFW